MSIDSSTTHSTEHNGLLCCANHTGNDQTQSLAQALAQSLLDLNLTCATAESCTGGLLGGALTALPGSSRWYKGGVIAYANEIKTALLGVPASMVQQHGAVSENVACAMALGVCTATGADTALATTGIAGPEGGSPQKPVGTVWIAWAQHGHSKAQCFLFEGNRDAVRRAAVCQAIRELKKALAHMK